MTGQACMVDAECVTGEVCCTEPSSRANKSCGSADRGCVGTIGDKCQSDSGCVEGHCNGTFCTKACTSNAQCGTSPWGVANICDEDDFGDDVCFPGCSRDQDCQTNVPGTVCDFTTDGSMACL